MDVEEVERRVKQAKNEPPFSCLKNRDLQQHKATHFSLLLHTLITPLTIHSPLKHSISLKPGIPLSLPFFHLPKTTSFNPQQWHPKQNTFQENT